LILSHVTAGTFGVVCLFIVKECDPLLNIPPLTFSNIL
jgi:hypothetical protein